MMCNCAGGKVTGGCTAVPERWARHSVARVRLVSGRRRGEVFGAAAPGLLLTD